MYYTNEDALENLLTLIKRSEEMKAQLEVLNQDLEQAEAAVKNIVTLPQDSWRYAKGNSPLKYAISNFNEIIKMKSEVEKLLITAAETEKQSFELQIGDILKVKNSFSISNSNDKEQWVIDPSGGSSYYPGRNYFMVLDKLDAMNYVLVEVGSNGLWFNEYAIYATKSQIEIFMEPHTEAKPQKDWYKIEFSLSGPNPIKYAKYFEKMRIFGNAPCAERYKSEFDYDSWYDAEATMLNLSADEVFGIMGTAYVCGTKPNKFSSFVLHFDGMPTDRKRNTKKSKEKIKIGFHFKEGDTFEYDPNISYFISGNFPKDVFVDKQKVINILSVTELVDYKSLKEQALA